MIFSDLNTKQKGVIISVALIFIIMFALLFLLQPHNQYGKEIGINNYNKYISNLPTDQKDAINSNLYNIVKWNSTSSDPSIKDAAIRDGSVEYTNDATKNIYYGSFIVDVLSIKQSYLVHYIWSPDKSNVNLGGYAATIECLPSSKLIYGNFTCKDDFNRSPIITNSDPILDYLPHSTLDYNVTGNYNGNKLDLNVDILLSLSDTLDNKTEDSINKYKSQVVDWIKSIKLNPDNYSITYNIYNS